IYKPNTEPTPAWLSKHAHVENKGKGYFEKSNNTVYVSKDLLLYKKEQFIKNGAIGFAFNDNLILTQSGNRNRTVWELPKIFHPDNGVELSYNPKHNWTIENDKAVLKSAGRGQEFVFKADPKGQVEKWCIDLIKNSNVTD
ncbi:MAG: hypothetical protein IT247_05165, partial [Bacteroidia bacterium]|nr:hypothetical protein [Bacteroidia bacterium]